MNTPNSIEILAEGLRALKDTPRPSTHVTLRDLSRLYAATGYSLTAALAAVGMTVKPLATDHVIAMSDEVTVVADLSRKSGFIIISLDDALGP